MNDERTIFLFNSIHFADLNHEQLQIFNDAGKGMRDRDLEIVQIATGDERYNKFEADSKTFTVILIGKDGTEKYRTHDVLLAENLFSLIDAMPLRQEEMKKDSDN